VCAGVSFQIEGIVESFATEGAKVALAVAVTLHVAVKEPLQAEDLGADAALKLGWVGLGPDGRKLFHRLLRRVRRHRILDSVPSVDQFDRHVRWNSELRKNTKNS